MSIRRANRDPIVINLATFNGCATFSGSRKLALHLTLLPYILILSSVSYGLHAFATSPLIDHFSPRHYLILSIYSTAIFSSTVTFLLLRIVHIALRNKENHATTPAEAKPMDSHAVDWRRIEYVLIALMGMNILFAVFFADGLSLLSESVLAILHGVPPR